MKTVVVDTSALVAVALGEVAGAWVFETLGQTSRRLVSSASVVELSVVLTTRLGAVGPDTARSIIRQGQIEEIPLDSEQAEVASRSFSRFGKGRHRASLNFGDCFVYGLAHSYGVPIVCLGNDFPQTDLETINPN